MRIEKNFPEVNQYKKPDQGKESKQTKDKYMIKDEYIRTDEKKVTYEKPVYKRDDITIQKLKEESEKAYENLKRMVKELLERQGLTFQDLDNVQVDEQTRMEAETAISEGGYLSPEKVSDSIVEFAKAISGGDIGKLEELREAIKEGFKQAEDALGTSLPDISKKTYDLIMEKLDQWAEEE